MSQGVGARISAWVWITMVAAGLALRSAAADEPLECGLQKQLGDEFRVERSGNDLRILHRPDSVLPFTQFFLVTGDHILKAVRRLREHDQGAFGGAISWIVEAPTPGDHFFTLAIDRAAVNGVDLGRVRDGRRMLNKMRIGAMPRYVIKLAIEYCFTHPTPDFCSQVWVYQPR